MTRADDYLHYVHDIDLSDWRRMPADGGDENPGTTLYLHQWLRSCRADSDRLGMAPCSTCGTSDRALSAQAAEGLTRALWRPWNCRSRHVRRHPRNLARPGHNDHGMVEK
jgi:hypothetical protein